MSLSPDLAALAELVTIVSALRHPEHGCPWDLAQTPQSLAPYIIEEAYETVDALTIGSQKAICEELGDLLLQVVLQSQIAQERGDFTLQDVATGICQKLIRRHPHVFGESRVNSVAEVRQKWEEIKAQEATGSQSFSQKLTPYVRSLPPLESTLKISTKAAAIGFEWPDIGAVWQKYDEEIAEFQHALHHESSDRQQEELGDVLFSLLQVARWHQLNPTLALMGTNQRFLARLSQMEQTSAKPLEECTLDELEQLWQRAKEMLHPPA